ncbi:MAG: efflux RND transporter permease subunit [Bacteroidia bacterium]|nr:efflux RND transporter permease subunit [Bacteroidia bacterium]
MINFCLQRPIATLVSVLSLCLLGLLAGSRLPVSLMPAIDLPVVTVQLNIPNWTAEDIDRQVMDPLRRQLLECDGLDDLHTEVRSGTGSATLRFQFGRDMQEVFWEVNEKVDRLWANFPRELPRPLVLRSRAADLPVFMLNLSYTPASGKGHAQAEHLALGAYAREVLRPLLEQLPEIALVDLTGLSEAEVRIQVNQLALQRLGVSLADIRAALSATNIPSSSFVVEEDQYAYTLRFTERLRTIEDVKRIRLLIANRMMSLDELATISLAQRPRQSAYLYQGQAAIGLGVVKHPDTRISELKQAVNRILEGERNRYPDISFSLTEDQSLLLEDAFSSLTSSLVAGGGLAFLVLFFFLKDAKTPWLIGLSVVVALLMSLLAFYLLQMSLNLVSISGIILGIGLMIDNAIIVVDSIMAQREAGNSAAEASLTGSRDVQRPLLSSALTTVSVFLPLTLIPGLAGTLFREQALAISTTLLLSYLVSVLALPVMYLFWVKDQPISARSLSRGEHLYENIVARLLRRSKLTFAGIALILTAGWLSATRLPLQRLPDLPSTATELRLSWNSPLSISESESRMKNLLAHCQGQWQTVTSQIGPQQFALSQTRLAPQQVKTWFSCPDEATLLHLKASVSAWLKAQHPETNFAFSVPPDPLEQLLGSTATTYVIALSSQEEQSIPSFEQAHTFRRDWVAATGMALSPIDQTMTFWVEANPEQLLLYQVSWESVYQAMASAMEGLEVAALTEGRTRTALSLHATTREPFPESLNEIFVMNAQGDLVPVSHLVQVSQRPALGLIEGNETGPFIGLRVETAGVDEAAAAERVGGFLPRATGLRAEWQGNLAANEEMASSLGLGLLVSIGLLFAILAIQFESFRLPLIILAELPVTLGLVLISWWLLGMSVNIMSMIGLIVISGIVINDSILKIEAIQAWERQGMERKAAIGLGGKQRFRPIIMTSLTTMLAALPMVLGGGLGNALQAPLALTLVLGMVFGTAVSLCVIPVLYWAWGGRG